MNNLIIKAKQGDEKSMEEILEKFKPLVYKTSISYYIYGYDMEDIKQITILTIIQSVEKFNIELSNSFAAYVQKCIENQMNKEIEKASNKYYENKLNNLIKLKIDTKSKINLKEIIDENINIAEDYINKESSKELNYKLLKAIQDLDPKEKDLLKSLYVQGISVKEYAEQKNLGYHKIRYMKEKMLENLRKNL